MSDSSRFQSLQTDALGGPAIDDNRHRETMISGLGRWRGPNLGRLHPEFVAGYSWIREDTTQSVSTAAFTGATNGVLNPPGPFGPFTPMPPIVRTTWGIASGVDGVIKLNSHLSLVPQVRVHWVRRAQFGDPPGYYPTTASYFLDLSPIVIRWGLGLRVML